MIKCGNQLIILIGDGAMEFCKSNFSVDDIISRDDIREMITGGRTRFDHEDSVEELFLSIVMIRLYSGQRVVVADHMNEKVRLHMIHAAREVFVDTIYYGLVNSPSDKYKIISEARSNNISLIDMPTITVINKPKIIPNNLVVFGDIHGNAKALQEHIDEVNAKYDNPTLLFLGDLVDPTFAQYMTWDVISIVHDYFSKGRAIIIRGNHDMKLNAYMMGNDETRLNIRQTAKYGMDYSIDQFQYLSNRKKYQAQSQFLCLYENAYDFVAYGKMMFAHASITKHMVETGTTRKYKKGSSMESSCYYGENDGTLNAHGYINRTSNWVNDIPDGHTAVVGHEYKSITAPVTIFGSSGGKAIFLDTGSGKLTYDGDEGILSHLLVQHYNLAKDKL